VDGRIGERERHPSPEVSAREPRRRPTLSAYVERRLGTGAATMARNVVFKPLGAGSFGQFWQYWNPVYGYFLYYYAYSPCGGTCRGRPPCG
jgi:hypothetical protein